MKTRSTAIAGFLFLGCWTAALHASPREDSSESQVAVAAVSDLPVESILVLAERVSGAPRKRFLLEQRVPDRIATGDIGAGPVSYSLFLTILHNNELAAVVSGDAISIIPSAGVRARALRTVSSLDEALPDDEWVNFTIRPRHVSAPQLVPILRPLMPQAGHLAALPERNVLICVDRFANVKRLSEIIRQLDVPGERVE